MGHQLTEFQESSDELADRLDAPVTALLVRGNNNNNTEAPSSSHPWEPLNLHPKFSDIYRRWQTYLLSGDGPLNLQDRHYIAIMASSRYGAGGLVSSSRSAFLAVGGEPAWLQGIHRAPAKLRRLAGINKILAHRPWTLTQAHVKELTVGEGSWSLSELVQAIVILIHFHSGSSFVLGAPESKSKSTLNTKTESRSQSDESLTSSRSQVLQAAREPLRTPMSREPRGGANQAREPRSIISSRSSKGGPHRYCSHRKGRTMSETKVTFKDDLIQELEEVYSLTASKQQLPAPLAQYSSLPIGQQQSEEPELAYVPFTSLQHDTASIKLKVHDFSWDDHGYSVLSRFNADLALLLDDKFRIAKQMTYNFLGEKKDVDTTLHRRAIWNYVQSLFGVEHDDFDYSKLGEYMTASLQQFVRESATEPANLANHSIQNLMLDSKLSEKVHVKILIMESKMQALALFALRAVMEHMA